MIAYPTDLGTIKLRLQHRFYRLVPPTFSVPQLCLICLWQRALTSSDPQAPLCISLGCQIHCTQRPHFQRAEEQNCPLCKDHHQRPPEIYQVRVSGLSPLCVFIHRQSAKNHLQKCNFFAISTVIQPAQISWKYTTLLRRWMTMMRYVWLWLFIVPWQHPQELHHFPRPASSDNPITVPQGLFRIYTVTLKYVCYGQVCLSGVCWLNCCQLDSLSWSFISWTTPNRKFNITFY